MSKNGICPLALHLVFDCADIYTVLELDCPSHERLLCGPACSPLVLLLFPVLPLFIGILVFIERKIE